MAGGPTARVARGSSACLASLWLLAQPGCQPLLLQRGSRRHSTHPTSSIYSCRSRLRVGPSLILESQAIDTRDSRRRSIARCRDPSFSWCLLFSAALHTVPLAASTSRAHCSVSRRPICIASDLQPPVNRSQDGAGILLGPPDLDCAREARICIRQLELDSSRSRSTNSAPLLPVAFAFFCRCRGGPL